MIFDDLTGDERRAMTPGIVKKCRRQRNNHTKIIDNSLMPKDFFLMKMEKWQTLTNRKLLVVQKL
jgi:hypothetical protein